MIFDKQNLFSDAQAITATAASTNVIDLGATGTPKHGNALVRDLGKGNPVPIRIQSVADFTAAGAATLTVALQVDTVENFASPKTVYTTSAIALADLAEGSVINLEYVPRGTDERYMRLNYTVATGPMTGGAVTAGIVLAGDDNG